MNLPVSPQNIDQLIDSAARPATSASPVLAAVAALDAFAGERLYADQADVLLGMWAHVGDLDDDQRAEVISYYPPREDGAA